MENIENQYQINPNNPHWNWLIAFGFWILSIVFVALLQGVFAGVLIAVNNLQTLSNKELTQFLTKDPTSIFVQILSIIPAHILTIVAAWFLVTNNGKISFTEALGWKWNGFNIWSCLILVGGFYVLAAGLVYIFGQQDDDFQKILQSSKATLYTALLMATFSAPIVEEVVYRGIVYSAFFKKFGAVIAIILSSVLFAGVHYPQYWGNYASLIGITTLSFVIGFVRYKTDNLLPCIALHFVFNASQCLILLVSSIMGIMPQPAENPAFIILK